MRKGFNGLASLAEPTLRLDLYSGHLFVLRGRRGDLIKVIWWDGQGACLLSKRLERGRFVWPSPADGKVVVTPRQLAMLLEGIANLVVWPKVFEQNRRTILSSGMIAVRGRAQQQRRSSLCHEAERSDRHHS